MPTDTLRKQLEQLQAELNAHDELDPELQSLLRQVADDIESVLAERPEQAPSVRERLEEATVRFEADHPNLSRALSELTDTLAKLGL